jgi:lysozyme family protein
MSLADIRQRDPVAAWAIARTLKLEGGLSQDPRDPGGVTNCGVSLRYALQQIGAHPEAARLFDIDHDGQVDRRDIEGLTADEAAEIYFEDWWRPGWQRALSPPILAWKAFDTAVNAGPRRAAVILQTALCARGAALKIDGVAGPVTLAAALDAARGDQCAALLAAFRAAQADFYRLLVSQQPKLRPFLAGWLARAAA